MRVDPANIRCTFIFPPYSSATFIFFGLITVTDLTCEDDIGLGADRFRQLEGEIRDGIQSRYDEAVPARPAGEQPARPRRRRCGGDRLAVLVQPLADATFSAAYIGYADGDFILIRRLARFRLGAVAGVAGRGALVQSLVERRRGQREGRFLFFDAGLRRLETGGCPITARIRASGRGFATRSQASDRWAAPYPFFTTGEAGFTVAHRSTDRHAVAGIDVALSRFRKARPGARPARLLSSFSTTG